MSDPTAIGPPVWHGPPVRRRRRDVDWSDPFSRLALVHCGSVVGETLIAISLAKSLFFSTDPANGRGKVLLGLLIAMAPFAVVGPMIGPLIDKVPGGHRVVIISSMAIRAVMAAAMAVAAADDSLLLFPEAFVMLVLGKTYQIARAAQVPATVEGDDALVEANSHLQVLSGLATIAAGVPGLLALAGAAWSLAFTAIVFALTTGVAFGLAGRGRPGGGAAEPADVEEDRRRLASIELRSGPVMTAATSMAILRTLVGFVTFALAFELRGESGASAPPKWYFGAVIAVTVLGGLVGASIAPTLRRAFSEERILLGSTVLAALVGLTAMLVDGLLQDVLLAAGIAVAATAGKQAFDALVQRDAPDADRGRLFARFESGFQLVWVLGAVAATSIHVPLEVVAVLVLVAGVTATVLYATGMRRLPVAGDPPAM